MKTQYGNNLQRTVLLVSVFLLMLQPSGINAQKQFGEKNVMSHDILLRLMNNPTIAFQQDTILLLNGKSVTGKIIECFNDELAYVDFRNGKAKVKNITTGDVFHVLFSNGSKECYYKQDTIAGNYLTGTQMNYYLQGIREGRKQFKAPLAFAAGILVGAGAPFLSYGSAPAIFLYTQVVRTNPRVKSYSIGCEDIFYEQQRNVHFSYDAVECSMNKNPGDFIKHRMQCVNDSVSSNNLEKAYYYNEGYSSEAKRKKSVNAFLGSAVGFLVSTISVMLLVR